MSDLNKVDREIESWSTPGPPEIVKIQPYADMPGTHENEARGAAISAMWAIGFTGVGGFLFAVGASNLTLDEYGNEGSTPLIVLAVVLGLIGSVLWAVALWKYLMHRSNEYALMVAQVRVQGGLPVRILEEFKTQPYSPPTSSPDTEQSQESSGNGPIESTE